MLTVRVIPCLDVRDGHVVKGVQFSNLRDVGDPAARAARYQREGADELVLLDVSATSEGRGARLSTVRAVRRVLSIPLTVGGGVRSVDDAVAFLEAGADKVAINSAAVLDPDIVGDIAARFGSQCTTVSIDARRGGAGRFEVVVRSGTSPTGLDVVQWAQEVVSRGAGEILLTSWDRDGTQAGYELDLIDAVSRAVPVPIVASGGAAGPDDMVAALDGGAHAVLAASIFHDGRWSVGDVKKYMKKQGIGVRP